MKKLLFFLLVLFTVSVTNAEQPLVKFHINDGTTKTYDIREIVNLSLLNSSSSLVMKIFRGDLSDVFAARSISKIEFGIDSNNKRILSTFIYNDPRHFILSEIDSILFYNIEPKIADNVLPITSDNYKEILGIDSNSINLKVASSISEKISPGWIIASGPTELAPDGLLRKVVRIVEKSNLIILETEQASLDEVIEQCVVSFQVEYDANYIDPIEIKNKQKKDDDIKLQSKGEYSFGIKNFILYDLDDDRQTTHDQARIEASLTGLPTVEFCLIREGWSVKNLTIKSNFKYKMNYKLYSSLEKEVDVVKTSLGEITGVRLMLPPITIPIGLLPLTITPEIDLMLNLKVGIAGEVGIGATYDCETLGGIEYNAGLFNYYTQNNSKFESLNPTLSVTGTAKASVGPQIDFSFYRQKSAFNCFINMLAFGELKVDFLNKPWWQFNAGVEVNAGVTSKWWKLLSKDFPSIFEYRRLIAQSTNYAESVKPTEGTYLDTITITGKGFGDVSKGKAIKFINETSGSVQDAYTVSEYSGEILNWSDTEILMKVPNHTGYGKFNIMLNLGGIFDNFLKFKILPIDSCDFGDGHKHGINETSTGTFPNAGITSLPDCISKFRFLAGFRCESNLLTDLPDGFKNLTGLNELYLSGNNFSSIPGATNSLVNLVKLDFSNNKLNSLSNLSNLTKLKSLQLSYNQLTEFSGITGLINLEGLTIDNNKLNSVPENIGNLVNLTAVSLKENQLTDLPNSLANLVNLKVLHLAGNKFKEANYVYDKDGKILEYESLVKYDQFTRKIQTMLPNTVIYW